MIAYIFVPFQNISVIKWRHYCRYGRLHLGLYSVPTTLSKQVTLSCLTCSDIGPRFTWSHPEDNPVNLSLSTGLGHWWLTRYSNPETLLYGSGWKTWWPGMFLCATKWMKYNWVFFYNFPILCFTIRKIYMCCKTLIGLSYINITSNNIFKIESLSVFQQHSNVNVIWNS